jgi:HAD superfamily hydrolase (TIGR01549 family)
VSRRVSGVVFDVGYTLIDETHRWRKWGEWLGVEPDELFASLRRVIAQGIPLVEALKEQKRGFDLERERAERIRAGKPDEFRADDLYPEVMPCIGRLKASGFVVGAAGNMPESVERFLAERQLGLDMIGSSERWGVQKPDRRFFLLAANAMELPTDRLAYVGDRVDNDVAPSTAAGMIAILVRRGLWAEVLEGRPEQGLAHAVIDSLDALPDVLP